MVTSKTQHFERVIQEIAPNSKLLYTSPLKDGVSSQMTAFEIEHPNGKKQKLILRQPNENTLKQNPNAASDEFQLLQITKSSGLPTQTPYHLDESCQIFSTPYLVIEYIEGEMLFAPSQVNNHMHQLAAQLAKIHITDCVNNNLSFLSERTTGCPEICRKQSSKSELFNESHIRKTLQSLWPVPQKNAATLLHGDFWPGNTLWQNDKLVAVIDWEGAERGDPLIDLAKSRSEIVWIFGIDAMNAFTRHYQSLMVIDYTNLPYWDLCAALRFIRFSNSNLANLASFFIPFGRLDITEQTIKTHYDYFITQAFKML